MAPVGEILKSLLRRDNVEKVASNPVAKAANDAAHELVKRSTSSPNIGSGAKPASSFNNQGFFALFALIGAGLALGTLWFFFWAPNGGFKWRQGDWDDYKSTVLRRKGPDGRTLSNATKSTKLGGGSIVHGGSYGRAATEAGDNESYVDEKASSLFGQLRGGRGKRSNASKARDPELANYRHEKPARVGGLNRASDGTFFDYSATAPSSQDSELSQQPLVKDPKKASKEAKKQAAARQKQLEREQKEAAKKQKELAARDKKREKEKAKAMKKSSNKKESQRSYSPAKSGPDTPERNRRYADEMRSEVSYSTYSGETVTEDAYTDVYAQANTASNSGSHDSYYSSYRPNAVPNIARPPPAARPEQSTGSPSRQQRRQSRQRSSSAARHSSRRQSSHMPGQKATSSSSNANNSNSDDTGTKIYSHHIPGLSVGGGPGSIRPEESASNIGVGQRGRAGGGGGPRRGRNVMEGYRRTARSRRDSLSDSE